MGQITATRNLVATKVVRLAGQKIIFKLILVTNGCDISSEIALRLTSLDLSDDKSTLVQVMALCHQATSHYLNQYRQQAITWTNVDLDPCRHMTSLGHNELISSTWGISHRFLRMCCQNISLVDPLITIYPMEYIPYVIIAHICSLSHLHVGYKCPRCCYN